MSEVIAVLGLGEAGSLLARDLAAAGAAVRGYDPESAGAARGRHRRGQRRRGRRRRRISCSASTARATRWRREASLAALRPARPGLT